MAKLRRDTGAVEIDSHGIELRVFQNPAAWQRDFWVKIPISEQMLYHFWKNEKQPSLDDLLCRLANCFKAWLEENSDGANTEPGGIVDIPLPEFFD